jgi:hypothetical protein
MEAITKTASDMKASLPPGPWQDEPDLQRWVDPVTGLRCLIRRTGYIGHLCGYVKVGRGHPAYRKKRGHAVYRLRMHGGASFAGQPSTLTYREKGWWIGFDCAHAGDLSPGMESLLARLQFPSARPPDVYRDIEYVTNQVRYLAAQLKSHERRK